ncbi:meiosis protein MEI2 [Coccidioides posadasii str. Silveira]|uniref:Meiosis protein MEI2 n=1 Tax=Coccidioides posadasii (strain RMSCC 757 / Silveira) TaxID=443226 RepID=E9CS14_COCPS|nr:meiosis protein MEI2 [Coccidioides posadasii str. Silveira]
MIRGNGSPGAASSNRSSDEAASHNGSPETKLTAFSPEDARIKSLLDNSGAIGLHRHETMTFTPVHKPGIGQDAFRTISGPNARIQLSPTASPFTPASYIQSRFTGNESVSAFLKQNDVSPATISYLAANSDPETPFTPNGSFARNSPPRFGPIAPGGPVHLTYPKQDEAARSKMSYLTATSEPETPFTPNGSLARNSPPRFGTIGHPYVAPTPIHMAYCQFGTFDKINRSRAFTIEGAPTDLAHLTIVSLFDRHEFSTLKGPILTELGTHGKIYVGFTDSRDAKAAFDKVKKQYPAWCLQALTAKEFTGKHDATYVGATSDYEGYIFASVYFNGNNPAADGRVISHNFKNILEKFGDVKAFCTIPTEQRHVVDFMVEFFDTRAAENVASTLNGSSVDLQSSRSDAAIALDNPYVELSPTGRSTIPVGDPASEFGWLRKAENNFSYRHRLEVGRRQDSRPSNQNYVDIEKIRLGLDVRTTIMLRNIPNKIDQVMLKNIVDETSFGNVGYAFINFEDFANARAGRTWNCFNSDKVAEISYATIQGRDCLVQKFRNSSVMLEHPSFRPKLFYTGSGPLAGTEEPFPGPDNPSKMRRSVENAEHVGMYKLVKTSVPKPGLFAPRVGQQYRDEQRRRRSQYDRGTTAAERETYCPRHYYPRRNSNSFAPTSRWCEFQYQN